MGYDSNRKALRGALPGLVSGFALLGISVGVPALLSAPFLAGLARTLRVEAICRGMGVIGAALLLVAAVKLSRARISGRYGYALLLFLALWAAELAFRLASFLELADTSRLAAARLVIAAAAMVALSTGMLWIWDRSSPRWHSRSWILTRRLFMVQLAALVLAVASGRIWAREPGRGLEAILADHMLFLAAAWLIFAAPYAHLFLSLRRSIRLLSRPRTVADILTG
jgi:hypothetical protein